MFGAIIAINKKLFPRNRRYWPRWKWCPSRPHPTPSLPGEPIKLKTRSGISFASVPLLATPSPFPVEMPLLYAQSFLLPRVAL